MITTQVPASQAQKRVCGVFQIKSLMYTSKGNEKKGRKKEEKENPGLNVDPAGSVRFLLLIDSGFGGRIARS